MSVLHLYCDVSEELLLVIVVRILLLVCSISECQSSSSRYIFDE